MTRIFFDLDRTLYDTDAMVQPIYKDMQSMGHTIENIAKTKHRLIETGYSFERHLEDLGVSPKVVQEKSDAYRAMQQAGDRFLYPGVIEGVRRLAAAHECLILTFGHPPFQQHKLECINTLKLYIQKIHYVDMNPPTKGEVIQSYGESPSWFIDDSPVQLFDVQAKAPWAHRVRIRWPNTESPDHPGDHVDWYVVRNMEELIELIEKKKE